MIEGLIRECQLEAQKAIERGDPPFGCVITDASGQIVARAGNRQNSQHDPTAHAEILALRKLGRETGTTLFDDHVMFANAASCPMCSTAAIKAGITTFYYGAPAESQMSPWLPMEDVAAKARNPVDVFGPFLADECAAQITRGRAALSK